MSQSIILEQLKQSKENQEIIGIWTYNDSDGFWAGYVVDLTDELYTIQHFTKYGKSDGLVIEPISGIKNIDFDDDYSRAMNYLIEHSSELDVEKEISIKTDFTENWELNVLKQLEGNYDVIVRVEIQDDEQYSGFISRVSDSDFVIHCVGELGEDEEKVIYRIEDLTAVRINDLENRKRAMLFKWRKSLKS